MKPVLPAFAGHVPADLKRIYPEADIQHLGKWAGFADAYRCNFLNPNDALFAKIQKLFLDEQKKLFGTDHIYGLDPFNGYIRRSYSLFTFRLHTGKRRS